MFARVPRCLATAFAAAVIAVAMTSLSQASTPIKSNSVAVAARYGCGGFNYQHARYHVTVMRGHVRCRTARHVMHGFLSGHGRMHGPKGGPAYKQYWTLHGWKCGHGAGGGGCVRHHSRQVIEAAWVRNTR